MSAVGRSQRVSKGAKARVFCALADALASAIYCPTFNP